VDGSPWSLQNHPGPLILSRLNAPSPQDHPFWGFIGALAHRVPRLENTPRPILHTVVRLSSFNAPKRRLRRKSIHKPKGHTSVHG